MNKSKLYKVTETNRMDVIDDRYTIYGGLTKEKVMEMFNVDKENFDGIVEDGYIGKDGSHEWEIEEE